MKRKSVTKIISVAIALIMILSTIPMAFAAKSKTPVVVVPGMGAVDLVYIDSKGTTAGTSAFPSFGTGTIADLIEAVMTMTFPKNGSVNIDEVYKLVKEVAGDLLEPIACNSDGTTKYDVGVIKTWETDEEGNIKVGTVKSCADAGEQEYINSRTSAEPAVAKAISDKVGAENVFVYKYDWRMNTLNHADELNQYIEAVKAQTGSSKVILVSGSMGTAVTSAYINNYKAAAKSSIERCIFLSSAFKGTTLVGEMMSGKLELSKTSVCNYLSSMDLGIVNMLLNGSLYDTLDALFKNYKDKIYNEILLPTFRNMPGMWSVMDMSYKASAVSFAKPSITSFIDSYSAIQNNFNANMTELKKSGIQFAVVAQYGFAGIPISANANYYTDNLIDTKLASAGATVAAFGETVKASGASVSSDGRVDASTALFADSTWFIKSLGHMGYSTDDKIATMKTKLDADKAAGKEVDAEKEALIAEESAYPLSVDLISWLVTTNSLSVGADAKYPQFTAVDEYNRLVPLNKAMETGSVKALTTPAVVEETPVQEEVVTVNTATVQTNNAPVVKVETADVALLEPEQSYTWVITLAAVAFVALAGSAIAYAVKKKKIEE